MKIKLFVLFSLLLVHEYFYAENIKLDIKSHSIHVEGDSLVVSMKYTVDTQYLGSNGAFTLIPVIKGSTQSKELSPVLLNSKKRQRVYERTEALNKRKGIKNSPAYLVMEVTDSYPREIAYRSSVLLEDWMKTSEVLLKKVFMNDSGKIQEDGWNSIGDMEPDLVSSTVIPEENIFASKIDKSVNLFPTASAVSLKLKGSYISPESDAMDTRNQKEMNFSLEEARVMAEMNPEVLSLRELYMVALSYKDQPEQFYKIIETSVKINPAHPIANLNAAAAAIEQGNVKAAGKYLQMAPHETVAYENCRGAYELMCGNLYEGIRLLKSAKTKGSEDAEANLSVFFETNKRF